MIKISNLFKTFGERPLFEGVNFCVHRREKIGIIGRNGAGKSTLLKMIAGEEMPDAGKIFLPKYYVLAKLNQHLSFSEPTVLAEARRGFRQKKKHEWWREEMILSGLGFSKSDFEKSPKRFSGGFQIRINLAKMLLSEPDLLLLDEPTNYLDVVSIRWLERFLKKWRGELMLVTHDRAFMDRVTTHTLAIHRGKIRKIKGKTADADRQIFEEEKIFEKTRIAMEKKRAKTDEFVRKFRAGARSAGLVQSRLKMLEKLEPKQKLEKIPQIQFHFLSKKFSFGAMISAHRVGFGFEKNKKPLIENLDLNIFFGDKIGIVGKNGAGKSTLLKLLMGEIAPKNGTIKRKMGVDFGYFSQTNTQTLDPQKTIFEELLAGKNATEEQIRKVAAALLFRGNDIYKKIAVISGGEKSRVSLGKILLTPVSLLFLDEPTNHLDMESSDALCDALLEFSGAVIFVSHNENFLSRLAKKLVIFDDDVRAREMSYPTFLREIGWKSEKDADLFQKEKSEKNPKNLRKDFQKNLRKVEKQIAKTEKEIEKLEKENDENTAHLQKSSLENDHFFIRKYGEMAAEKIQKINEKYHFLENLLNEKSRLETAIKDFF